MGRSSLSGSFASPRASVLCRCVALVALSPLLLGVAQAQTRTVTYSYDAYGALAQEVVEPSGDINTVKVTTNYIRDDAIGGSTGVLTQTQIVYHDPQTGLDVTRNVQTLTYDPKYRYAATVSNAKGQSESRTYDEGTGNLLSLIGPNSLTTSWQYDGWSRKVKETRADGTSTTYAWRQCIDTCLDGAVTVAITQNWYGSSQTTVPSEAFSDSLGRAVLTRTWGFAGTAILAERVFNAQGRLDHRSRPYFAGASAYWSYLFYDPIGRVTQVQTPNAAGTGNDISMIGYSGLVTTETNPKGQVRTETRNGQGKLRSVLDANGFTTSYRYDGFANLLRTTDPKGNQISVTYDNLGRKTGLADPDLGNWSYLVNPLGQTWQQTDAKAQSTSYSFDELGRLTHRVEPDLESFWLYDSATKGVGKLAEAYTWVAGAKDYRRILAYDSFGRPASTTISLDWDYVEEYAYDGFQRPNATSYRRNARGGSGGPLNTLTSLYNAQGYASQLNRFDGTTTNTVRTVLLVDAEGHSTREQLGNSLKTDRGYNVRTGRLESLATGPDNGSGGATPSVQSDGYAYDSIGNLTSRSQLAATSGASVVESFGYDALNRLSTSQVTGQPLKADSYDETGNLASKDGNAYAYPTQGAGSVRPHALSGISGTLAGVTNPSFVYDANGNLTGGLNRAYTWTSYNQAATIGKLSAGSEVQRTAFFFGTEHQRSRQTVSPVSGGIPGSATSTIYYAGAIEKEINAAANTTTIRTYVSGAGYIEESFSGTSIAPTSSGTRNPRYFHTDHLGSLLVITDQSQAVLQRMSYDPWGRRRNADGTDDTSASLGSIVNGQEHTGYTGQEQLDQLALVHLGGRIYDPITGRMTSADPTIPDPSDAQSFNRFSYVLNNALAYVDPSGFDSVPAQALTAARTAADPFSTGNVYLLSTQGCDPPGSPACSPPPPPPPAPLPPDPAAGSPAPRVEMQRVEVTGHWRMSVVRTAASTTLTTAAQGGRAALIFSRLLQSSPIVGGYVAYSGSILAMLQNVNTTVPGACTMCGSFALIPGMNPNAMAASGADQGQDASDALGANSAAAGGAAPPPDGGDNDKDKVRFGKNANQESHAFRHVDEAGLDRGAVRDSIKQDLSKVGDSLKEGLYNGRVNVNGTQVDYAAYKFPDGTINVGRITPPKPGP